MNIDSNPPWSRRVKHHLKKPAVIGVLIVLAGLAALVVIFSTEPGAQREGAVRATAMLVDVTRPEAGDFRPVIEAMGAVRPARQITLRPRVAGQVTSIESAFTPGGRVDKGDVLLRIDEADYRNALEQRRSELAQAEAELAIERGEQVVAERDYRELGRDLPPAKKALVQREPQLKRAKAQVRSARAAVAQAELELERTTVTAPFDAQVLTREANVGSQVSASEPLARLAGRQTYWVEAAVPMHKLQRLSFADGDARQGSLVRVRNRTAWPEGVYREGYLYRLIGELEGETRLARVLVAVDDPLAIEAGSDDTPPLMLGAYVESRIRGRPIENTFKLSRDYIRKDDTVWLMRDGRLVINEVDIVFRDAEHAYIRSGLSEGDRVVTTNLATVKEGVKLRLKQNGTGPDESDSAPGGAEGGSAQQ